MSAQGSKQAIPFYKLQGAGNDFVVVLSEHLKCAESDKPVFMRAIADRRLGIGCDQVLELTSLAPLSIQIWNQDGSRAEMCANGARAFGLLADDKKWIPTGAAAFPLHVSGRAFSLVRAERVSDGFAINLGKPNFVGVEVLSVKNSQQAKEVKIPVHIVTAPNPHAVVVLGEGRDSWLPPERLANFDFRQWGPLLERHSRFPERTNVEFVYKSDVAQDGHTRAEAKVWERGSGATLSSGSGSVAVATALWQRGARPDAGIEVQMNGFSLNIFKNKEADTLLSGPASILAKGEFYWLR